MTVTAADGAFSVVRDAQAVELLLEHSRDYYDHVLSVQDLQREKAKLLLGSTTFTMAVIAFSATLMKDFFRDIELWWFIILLVLFGVVMGHFVRSLMVAVRATMLETVVAVSTQEVVELGSTTKGFYDEVTARRSLAARYRAAATQTNLYLGPVKNQIVLAQACFKWGLYVLPVFVVVNLVMAYSASSALGPRSINGVERNAFVDRVELVGVMNRLADLDNQVATLLAGQREAQDASRSVRSELEEMRSAASLINEASALEVGRSHRRSDAVDSLVATLADRVAALEKRVGWQRSSRSAGKGGGK